MRDVFGCFDWGITHQVSKKAALTVHHQGGFFRSVVGSPFSSYWKVKAHI